MLVSDYQINTITMTGDTGLPRIDLTSFFEGLDISETSRVAHAAKTCKDSVQRRGQVTKRNGRKKVFRKAPFGNQVTVDVRMPYKDGYNLNIKVFGNGKIQMTGARTVAQGKEGTDAALATIGASVSNLQIQLMNCHFRVHYNIDRFKLHTIVSERYGVESSFIPSIYPGVKMFFMYNTESREPGVCPNKQPRHVGCPNIKTKTCCKRITVIAFHTGAVIITGGVSREQVDAAHGWFGEVVTRHKNEIIAS